jgi:UDP-N-acetylmuramoyl-tripeptide--D-alanyl-D-alanine ligase
VNQGDVFVALEGATTDGHHYVAQALQQGAVAALVRKDRLSPCPASCLEVQDPLAALQFLAAAHRRALPTRIIALTGSVGKTTTKDMIYELLSPHAEVLKTRGNRNSQAGLPTEVLRMNPKTMWMVAEVGMSHSGEIARLTKILQPQFGLLLSIQAAHSANFKSFADIAAAKGELVSELPEESTLIYNADDSWVARSAKKFSGSKWSYGFSGAETNLRGILEPFTGWMETGFHFLVKEERYRFMLPLVGKMAAQNALAAAAAAYVAGLSPKHFTNVFRRLSPSAHRGELFMTTKEGLMVDDSYNASPFAMRAVLEEYAKLSSDTYRWLVLGDMLELSEEELNHRQLGQQLWMAQPDALTLVGPRMKWTIDEVHKVWRQHHRSSPEIQWFETVGEAIDHMPSSLPQRARIWVKGSRGIGLDAWVKQAISRFDAARVRS